jgi:hypothetical protein
LCKVSELFIRDQTNCGFLLYELKREAEVGVTSSFRGKRVDSGKVGLEK